MSFPSGRRQPLAVLSILSATSTVYAHMSPHTQVLGRAELDTDVGPHGGALWAPGVGLPCQLCL